MNRTTIWFIFVFTSLILYSIYDYDVRNKNIDNDQEENEETVVFTDYNVISIDYICENCTVIKNEQDTRSVAWSSKSQTVYIEYYFDIEAEFLGKTEENNSEYRWITWHFKPHNFTVLSYQLDTNATSRILGVGLASIYYFNSSEPSSDDDMAQRIVDAIIIIEIDEFRKVPYYGSDFHWVAERENNKFMLYFRMTIISIFIGLTYWYSSKNENN